MHSRNQYLEKVRQEYERADKQGRGRLLDEAEKRTGLNRKVLIRKLSRPPTPASRERARRRRGPSYGAAVVTALVVLWEIFDYACGQRLVPVLRREVDRLRRLGELRCGREVLEKLKKISAKTVDRLLARERRVRMLRRGRTPGVHPLLYQKIPVKVAADWDTSEVGNLQVDYVAHSGRSGGGEYVHTLSVVDIASGWWEGEAIAGRSQQATREGLDGVGERLPFRMKEIHPDNDSGMINDLLWRYCRERRIAMSRSRPYQKNDNAWVEQKNWTHVRKVVGYGRYDTTRQMALLNEIYAVSRLYKNFCQPVIKLASKERIGGKIHRRYDEPRTPYERLLESGQLDRKAKAALKQIYESLNPAELKRRLEALRSELFDLGERKGTANRAKPRHGPGIWFGRQRRAASGH